MATKKTAPQKSTTQAPDSTGKRNNSFYLKLLLVVLVVVGGIYSIDKFVLGEDSAPASTAKSLTKAEVEKHAVAEDCWLIIENKVYDATTLIAKHTGGAKNVSDYCGKDASTAWNTKSKPVAKLHSEAAKLVLSGKLLGDLQ